MGRYKGVIVTGHYNTQIHCNFILQWWWCRSDGLLSRAQTPRAKTSRARAKTSPRTPRAQTPRARARAQTPRAQTASRARAGTDPGQDGPGPMTASSQRSLIQRARLQLKLAKASRPNHSSFTLGQVTSPQMSSHQPHIFPSLQLVP